MITRIINKFQKKDYDIEQENVTIHDYYGTFKLMFKVYGVLDGHAKRPWYWSLYMVFISASGALSVFLLCCNLQHAVGHNDLSGTTETAIYIIMFTYQTFILVGAHLDIEHFLYLRDQLEEAFVCISSPAAKKYRKRFYETHLLTWQLCIVWTVIVVGMACCFIIMDTFHIFNLENKDSSTNPFIIPIRPPKGLDPYESPLYQLFLLQQYLMSVTFTPVFMAHQFVTMICVGHLVSQLDIVIGDLDGLFAELPDAADQRAMHQVLRKRMKVLVDRHDAAYTYYANQTAIYRKWNAFSQMISTPAICFSSYSIANDLEHHKFNIIMYVLLGGAVGQYLVPCWGITIISTKFSEVGAACERAAWWGRGGAGCAASRDLRLVMARSQRPLPDHLPGFRGLDREEFLRTMTAAYSYFNMLRQINS